MCKCFKVEVYFGLFLESGFNFRKQINMELHNFGFV